MRNPLDPTWADRLRALRPDATRTLAARRAAAAALVLLAAAAALRPDPAGVYAEAVVAATDLPAGVALGTDDLRLEKRSAATLPEGTLTDLSALDGATLAGPARRGEVLTDARVVGPRLAALSAGPDARLVPLHLDDPAVLDVMRPGDVVDVLGALDGPGAGGTPPRVLATNAVVVLVSGPTAAIGPGTGEGVVLVALPAGAAHLVAAAALVQAVTVTLH